jgi:hypothetical protein
MRTALSLLTATVLLLPAGCQRTSAASHRPRLFGKTPQVAPPTGKQCTVEFRHLDTVEYARDVTLEQVTEHWVVVKHAHGRTSWIPRQHVLRIKMTKP